MDLPTSWRVGATPPDGSVTRTGAWLGLVGPSGSGKSTVAQIMALLLAPDDGIVSVDGARVAVRCDRELRHRVQQSPRMAVDPRLRVGDAIVEPLAAGGLLPAGRAERRALIAAWAARVGLTQDLVERFPHEVSEGQLQRACLARALIVNPRYLICDELSSMVDVSTQAALLEVIAAAQDERELGVMAHHPRPHAGQRMVRADRRHQRPASRPRHHGRLRYLGHRTLGGSWPARLRCRTTIG